MSPIISGGGGGGGSLPSRLAIPTADPAGVVVNTTTYDNSWLGVGKLTTLVFPQSTAAFAIAIAGDAFPRVIYLSNPTDGIYYGDGTVNPISNGAAQWIEAGATGEFVHVIEGGGATQLRVGVADPNAGRRVSVAGGLTFGTGSPGAFQILGGADDPNTSNPPRGGNVGDLFFRTNPAGANETIYRCTVAGTPGNATWVGIL